MQQSYLIAWIVYAVGGAGFALGFWRLVLRHLPRPLGELVLALGVATLALPWHPGSAEGVWAPAFVVAFFEAFLQADGAPGPPFKGLVAAWLLALGVVLGRWAWRRLRRGRAAPA